MYPAVLQAQDFSLSSERLNSLEEPIATDIAGITVEVNGIVDARIDYDFDTLMDDTDDAEPGVIGNFNINASTQLGNRWNVGIAYFGQYEAAAFGDEYTDNVAAFISGSYGTLLGGEVTDIVREETRRVRGIGNADLSFDDALGAADNWGGGYVGQFGPARVSGLVDEDGAFDLGFSWARPSGPGGYRYALRYTNADFTAADAVTLFDTNAITGAFEYTYGRTLLNLGGGYEHFEGPGSDAERWFLSVGAQHQFGNLSASLEGHYGEIDGQSERSAAAGLQYNMARGISLNLGVNHAKADVDVGAVSLLSRDESTATGSLRFGF